MRSRDVSVLKLSFTVLQQGFQKWSSPCVNIAIPRSCIAYLILVISDWDPTKWIISALHDYTPFVPTIATTPESEILKARAHVHRLHADRLTSQIPHSELPRDDTTLPQWTKADVARELEIDEGAVFLLIDGYIVDVGGYLDVHVSMLLGAFTLSS